jgi:hypothetical protein
VRLVARARICVSVVAAAIGTAACAEIAGLDAYSGAEGPSPKRALRSPPLDAGGGPDAPPADDAIAGAEASAGDVDAGAQDARTNANSGAHCDEYQGPTIELTFSNKTGGRITYFKQNLVYPQCPEIQVGTIDKDRSAVVRTPYGMRYRFRDSAFNIRLVLDVDAWVREKDTFDVN